VSVQMLQRSVAVEVDASMVERAWVQKPEPRSGFPSIPIKVLRPAS
jgi:hypothetical protein